MESLETLICKGDDFANYMEATVLPFVSENIKDGFLDTDKGIKLHYQYLINPDEKGTIIISHGYCEFCAKYYELLFYFYKLGYSSFIVEHRGHGYSTRQVKSFSKVHINHFEDYVTDFACFVEEVKRVHKSDHYYLYAHSMGGAVGTLYLEGYPGIIEKAILTSPMIEMRLDGVTNWQKILVKALSYIPGVGKLYLPGHVDYNHAYKFPYSSALCEPRYQYQYDCREKDEHYQSNGATMAWAREAINVSKKILKNANLVKIPAILFQASGDALVMPQPQEAFAKKSANTKLVVAKGSKHEIFNATDELIIWYYKQIVDFLEG